MRVLFAASECTPFAKVGGLGDVIGALPKELSRQGLSIDIVLPLYDHLLREKLSQVIVDPKDGNIFVVNFLGKEEKCKLFSIQIPDSSVTLYLIQNSRYLSNGGIYLSPGAIAEGDSELERFMFFSKAVYTLFERNFFTYDIVHAHDYHSSYLLYLFRNEKALGLKPRLILTVHNTENQGLIESADLNKEVNGLEQHHNLLGLGIASADVIVPVSSTYAQELLSGKFGFGLEHVFRAFSERVHGIVNGIDTSMYNPATDSAISTNYNSTTFESGKHANKASLFGELGLHISDVSDCFLVGFVGRLTHQKNIQLIVDTSRIILNNKGNLENIYFVCLGVGDGEVEQALREVASEFPHNFVFINRFDEPLAHRIFASCDLFLMPSEFEPCGLTQMLAMRYGALPLASRVGGLVDTISDTVDPTGFFMRSLTPDYATVQILDLYTFWRDDPEGWKTFVNNAMNKDFSWQTSAQEYISLYTH